MQTKENLWYRMGYALETVRNHLPATLEPATLEPATLEEDSGESTPAGIRTHDGSQKVLNTLLTAGAGSIVARALSIWPSRPSPSVFRLFRAGAAGAAAAFLAELVRPLLTGKKADSALEEELTDILFAGVGRGLLYAALVEPRVPGGPILQGAVYGGLEYALSPWGGLAELASTETPLGGIPALSVLLRDRETDEELVERMAYGVALALLYKI